MNFLTSLWNYLNGNKTKIGAAVSLLAQHIDPTFTIAGIPVQAALTWIGGTFLTVGVGHALIKSNAQPGATA